MFLSSSFFLSLNHADADYTQLQLQFKIQTQTSTAYANMHDDKIDKKCNIKHINNNKSTAASKWDGMREAKIIGKRKLAHFNNSPVAYLTVSEKTITSQFSSLDF